MLRAKRVAPSKLGHQVFHLRQENPNSTPKTKEYHFDLLKSSSLTLTVESQDPVARIFAFQQRQVTEESWQ